MQRFLIAMLLCLGLVTLMGRPAEAQFIKEVSGYLKGDTMVFYSRVPNNAQLDTIYRISGSLNIGTDGTSQGLLWIEDGAEVQFLPNGRIVDSTGGSIIANGFDNRTLVYDFTGVGLNKAWSYRTKSLPQQNRIQFIGLPVNPNSLEWGHIVMLPQGTAPQDAGRVEFQNCGFTNFKKNITVDNKPYYGTATPAAITNGNQLIALSNGTGAVLTTFSGNVFMNDVIVDNCEALYRGGAFAFIQTPSSSFFPTEDGRIALENGQIRRLTIRNTRVNNNIATAATQSTPPDNTKAYGGAIYMSGRIGTPASTTFRTARLGGLAPWPGAGSLLNTTDDIILIENCAALGASTATNAAAGGGIYVGDRTALRITQATFNTNRAWLQSNDAQAFGGAIAVSGSSGNPSFNFNPLLNLNKLAGLEVYREATFNGNKAGVGGAIHAAGTASGGFSASYGTSLAPGFGPAVININGENAPGGSNPGLIRFLNNVGYVNGGAIASSANALYVSGFLAPQTDPNYKNVELRVFFNNNIAGQRGGSVYLDPNGFNPEIQNRRVFHLANRVDPMDARIAVPNTDPFFINRAGYPNTVEGGGAEFIAWRDSTFATEYRGNFVRNGNGGAVFLNAPLNFTTAINRYFVEDKFNALNVTASPLPFDPRELTRFCDNSAHFYPGDSTLNHESNHGRGGAMFIKVANPSPAVAYDSTYFSRARMEMNYAFTGSAIYSDNYDLRLIATSTLIANNHATSRHSATVDLEQVGGTGTPQSNPADALAGATIWGEFEGPLPSYESNSRGNAIYDNTGRYILRLPNGPLGAGGVDTLRGNFWGDTGPDVITQLPSTARQRTFFIDYYRDGCVKNVYEPNRPGNYSYTAIPIGQIPDTLLLEGRVYDIFDRGTDIKTADYTPRRMAIQESFALGLPTDLTAIHRFTRDIFTQDPTYIQFIRNPLQAEFQGPHPIGYPLFLQADVDPNDNNRDNCASNYTVLFVINRSTNEFVRVNAKELGQDDNSGAAHRYQGRLDFVPDSSVATRNAAARNRTLWTLSLLRPATMTFDEIQRASKLEDSAALQGRRYLLDPTQYMNGTQADSICISTAAGLTTGEWYAGEKYHTLPVRPGDDILVISRTQLWKYGAAGAIARGLQFRIGDVLAPTFTVDVPTLQADPLNPNRRFLREDITYTTDPTDPNANLLFRVAGFDPNNFYDPRFQFDPSRYTQLSFDVQRAGDDSTVRLWSWLKDSTFFNLNAGAGSNGYVLLSGTPHNPDVVPGGEQVTLRVTNFPPNFNSESLLLGAGFNNLGPDSSLLSHWTFPPYMNCPTGFLSDTLCIRSASTTYNFRIFVQDSLPVFTSSSDSACAANLTDSLRYSYNIETDDEAEDRVAAGEGWDFRYGRTSYRFLVRPQWMKQLDNNTGFRTNGEIVVRLDSASAYAALSPYPGAPLREISLDTMIAIQADDGHTGLSQQKFRLPINLEPRILTETLPSAKEDFDYSLDFRDLTKVVRVESFDPNFNDILTWSLIYKGDTQDVYRDEKYKTGLTRLGGTTPAWLKIDPVSGVLYGTPGANDAPRTGAGDCGPEIVTVVVKDACGLTAWKQYPLTVDSTNHSPQFFRAPREVCVTNRQQFCETIRLQDIDLLRGNCGEPVIDTLTDRLNVTVLNPTDARFTFTLTPGTFQGQLASDTQEVRICGTFNFDDNFFRLDSASLPQTITLLVTDIAGNSDTLNFKVRVGDIPSFECAIDVSNLGTETHPVDMQHLCFGAGRFGKDSLDIFYCEFEQPPPPPSAVFDARWELPIGGSIKGTYIDIRRDTNQFTDVTWQVRFNAGNEQGSFLYPVRICWRPSCLDPKAENLKGFAGGNFYLRNPFGAQEFSINMFTGEGPINNSLYTLTKIGSDSMCLEIRNVNLDNAIIVFVPTKSGVDESPIAENIFSLEQNYPNPFNPSTTINFSVAKRSDVKIEVFDMKGSLVRTLVNEELAAGPYPVTWDGTNQAGAIMPSGSYVCKMTAGDYKSSIKMTLKK